MQEDQELTEDQELLVPVVPRELVVRMRTIITASEGLEHVEIPDMEASQAAKVNLEIEEQAEQVVPRDQEVLREAEDIQEDHSREHAERQEPQAQLLLSQMWKMASLELQGIAVIRDTKANQETLAEKS